MKTRILLFICLFLICSVLFGAQRPEKEPAREPGGPMLHFIGGICSAYLVSAVAFPLVDTGSPSMDSLILSGIGLFSAFLAGSGKELLDAQGFGDPEWGDLLNTLVGGAVAALSIFAVSMLFEHNTVDPLAGTALFAAQGLVLAIPITTELLKRLFSKDEDSDKDKEEPAAAAEVTEANQLMVAANSDTR